MKYKIITEASIDMPKEVAIENDVTILPIELRFGEELYPNGMENDAFYEKLKGGVMPKTSMPNQIKFEDALQPYVNKEDWFVLVVVISADLAGTLAQAKGAVDALSMKNVHVCDSRCTTFAQGALVMEILKYIKAHPNAQPDEVVQELERLKTKVRIVAVIGDLKYLRASGRLKATEYFVAGALNVKPVIGLEGGAVTTLAKKIGEKANEFMVECANKRDRNYPIYFGHSANPALIERFLKRYSEKLDVEANSPIYEIGCIIGAHAGPGCYGMVFFV